MKTFIMVTTMVILCSTAIPTMIELDTDTKMIVVCDSVNMESYYIKCLNEAMKDTAVLDSEKKYWREECRTQAISMNCDEKLHVLKKGKWIQCDMMPEKKRRRLCK